MADGRVDIECIDRSIARCVDAIEELAELQKVTVIGKRSRPPSVVEIRTIGRAANRTEGNPLAADLNVVSRIPREECESLRGGLKRRLNDLAPNANALPLYGRSGLGQDIPRFGIQNI